MLRRGIATGSWRVAAALGTTPLATTASCSTLRHHQDLLPHNSLRRWTVPNHAGTERAVMRFMSSTQPLQQSQFAARGGEDGGTSALRHDMSAIFGVGWNQLPDAPIASEFTLFCQRTGRTLNVPIPKALREPTPKLNDPAVVQLREKIQVFVDAGFRHLVDDISAAHVPTGHLHATAIFLPMQHDETSKRLETLLSMTPSTRSDASPKSSSLTVRGYYKVSPKDAWGIMYSFFVEKRREVKNLDLPKSLFDAYNKVASEPIRAAPHMSAAERWARVSVQAPMKAMEYFSGPTTFSESRLISKQSQVAAAVAARAIEPVRIFYISIQQRTATLADRMQLSVKIYDPVKKANKNQNIMNFADSKRLAELTKVLCRPASVTVLIIAPDTTESTVKSLLRGCKPTNPIHHLTVDQLSKLTPIDDVASLAASGTKASLPESWSQLCGRVQGSDEALLSVCTVVGRDRQRSSAATTKASGVVPKQQSPTADDINAAADKIAATILGASKQTAAPSPTEAARDSATTPAAASTATPAAASPGTSRTVSSRSASIGGKGPMGEKEIVAAERLNEYNRTIYEKAERCEREEAEAKRLKRWLVIDLETTTKMRYKRRANPFLPENYVVLPGFLDYKGNMTIPPSYCKGRGAFKLPDLSEYDVIVGHNVKFDLHYMWRDPQLVEFFRRGGMIWDTMYGEYLLSGHVTKLGKGAGLEDVARSYGGTTPKLDLVKEAWARGESTESIDHAILAEYLEGDLRNTALVFNQHVTRAIANRQVISCNLRMDGLLATTEMEFNGITIDRKLAGEQQAHLEEQLTVQKNKMAEMIPEQVPYYYRRQFNWASLPTLVAFVWGGVFKFAKLDGRMSGRVPDAKLYSAVEDVSWGAQIAWVANSLGPKVVKKYTELYLRERGFRTTNVYSEVFDTQASERRFDVYHTHVSTSYDDKFWGSVVGAQDAAEPLPRIDSPEFSQIEMTGITVACPIRRIAFEAKIVDSDGKPEVKTGTQKCAGDVEFTVTSVVGSLEAVRAQLKQFFVATSGDGEVVKRCPLLLGRGIAEYAGEVARRHGFDGGLLRDVVVDEGVDGATAADDAAADDDADTAATPVSGQVRSPTLQFADVLGLHEHAAAHFPAAVEAASIQFLAEEPPKAATTKGKKGKGKTAAAKPKAGDASSVSTIEKRLVGLGALEAATRSGLAMQHIVEEVTRAYTSAKAAAEEMGAESLPEKRRATPKRDMNASTLDLRFEMKGVPHMVYLDRAFNTAPAVDFGNTDFRRLVMLRHIGMLLGKHDVFVSRLDEEPVAHVELPGRVNEFIKDEVEIMELRAEHKSKDTGALQVGEAVLKRLKKAGDKVCECILEARGMEKMLSTYYDDKRTGMMALVNEHDSSIHHELIHNKTQTGRLASANPNCQNIPKEDKSEIRDLFISRFTNPAKKEQGLCVEVDYSQLEVVTLCALSNDINMTEDLFKKVDFHCKRVTLMHPQYSYEEIVQKAKKDKIPEFVAMRQAAKIFSFQRQYGAGVKMLCKSTGLSEDTVRKLIENEARTYYGIDQFYDMVTQSCNNFDPSLQDGARNKHGHQLYKGSFAAPTGSRYVFSETDLPAAILDGMKRRGETRTAGFSPTHLKNYPVQGFAGEIVQIMLGKLWRHFVDKGNYGGKALMINTVHDCVWIDARKEVAQQVCVDTERILSAVREVLNHHFPDMEVKVEFPVDVVAGETMGTVRPLKDVSFD